ncbi:OLC1v1024628C1 [Oldenlandia corymbosa var. corymbosa]|uniref:OLC1v1024628C1 n=1 Tax=Oldenlandia corymbosa var. corymbosa TaxID=529605 RepID=A0AAV1C530_OLDCO|nr:OLC1v1024628C1 [Oldenlandia corymbosa var. corymbosa]
MSRTRLRFQKKKGIKIKTAKLKWTLKGGDPKSRLEAQIVSLNPLVVKGVEKEAMMVTEIVESQPAAKTLAARLGAHPADETLAAQVESRQLESSSGLTVTEKEAIPVDLQASPVRTEAVCVDAPPLVQSENRFSILQAAEEDDIKEEMENVHSEVHTQSQKEQDDIGATLIDGELDLDKNRSLLKVELRNMSLVPQLDLTRSNDDSSENEIHNTEAVHDERELWSDGEIYDDHIVENDQGKRSVTKKRGRNSKEE